LNKEDLYGNCAFDHDTFRSDGVVSKRDGRLNISFKERNNEGHHIEKWLGKNIRDHTNTSGRARQYGHRGGIEEITDLDRQPSKLPKPRLNIVIMVIGSRGDIQPFLRVGQVLKERGHRVRIATHPVFRDFVNKEIGLDFFSVGGDPSELMAFMVKNPGMIPKFETVRHGEIAKRRAAMKEMFQGFWRSCINSTDDEHNTSNAAMMGQKDPFVVDAIIANPPSFAHVHIAERLGVPLHMMFTFPYSPTEQFPHPLANIKASRYADPSYANFMSYSLVELMTWRGLGDLINEFRENTLGLEPISALWAPDALWRMHVSHTYMWSPALLPKPKDWGDEINITGFVFLDLASNFKPPQDLTDFMEAGDPPVYIGFGSIVLDDPDAFTKLIFEAVKLSGVRALVSKGWGGIGGRDVPDNVFMLGDTPHDWLFPRCSAVIHHGGAGTTAIGLKCGIPTVIVPFFGDQTFWGAMVSGKKAGAHKSIPYQKLTAKRLAESIKQCLTEEARTNVRLIAKSIEEEGDGAENAVKSFENSLPDDGIDDLRCAIFKDRVAVWHLKHTELRFSALAAEMLVNCQRLTWDKLSILRQHEYNDFDGPGEPITGVFGAAMHSAHGFSKGFGTISTRMKRHVRHHRKKSRQSPNNNGTIGNHPKKSHQSSNDDGVTENHQHVKQDDTPDNNNTADVQDNGQKADVVDNEQKADVVDNGQKADDVVDNGQKADDVVDNDQKADAAAIVISDETERPLVVELAADAGTGLGHSLAAVFWTPLTLHLAFARGLHNAPRLYGDATVRKPLRITDMRSGLKAARDEFCYGFYDGATGLVTQPVNGVRSASGAGHKTIGCLTGLSKGIGGLILKPASAILGTPALMGHGFRREIQKHRDGPRSRSDALIRQSRIRQGQDDLEAIQKQDQEENGSKLKEVKQELDNGWRIILEARSAEEKKHLLHDRALKVDEKHIN